MFRMMVEFPADMAFKSHELKDLMLVCGNEDFEFARTYYQSGPFDTVSDIYDYLKQNYNSHMNKMQLHIEKVNRLNKPTLPTGEGYSLVYRNFKLRDGFKDADKNSMHGSLTRLTDELFYEFKIRTWHTTDVMSLNAVLYLYNHLISREKNSLPPAFYYNGELMSDSVSLFKEYQLNISKKE